jgi:hypothetical protein
MHVGTSRANILDEEYTARQYDNWEIVLMKWLEMIELRSVGCHQELLESQLQQLMHDVNKEADVQSIRAYHHVMIDTDVSIHLVHDSPNAEPGGSLVGLCLASSLRDFGLVNHSVWIEMSTT